MLLISSLELILQDPCMLSVHQSTKFKNGLLILGFEPMVHHKASKPLNQKHNIWFINLHVEAAFFHFLLHCDWIKSWSSSGQNVSWCPIKNLNVRRKNGRFLCHSFFCYGCCGVDKILVEIKAVVLWLSIHVNKSILFYYFNDWPSWEGAWNFWFLFNFSLKCSSFVEHLATALDTANFLPQK